MTVLIEAIPSRKNIAKAEETHKGNSIAIVPYKLSNIRGDPSKDQNGTTWVKVGLGNLNYLGDVVGVKYFEAFRA